jgi:hypothetical protein
VRPPHPSAQDEGPVALKAVTATDDNAHTSSSLEETRTASVVGVHMGEEEGREAVAETSILQFAKDGGRAGREARIDDGDLPVTSFDCIDVRAPGAVEPPGAGSQEFGH